MNLISTVLLFKEDNKYITDIKYCDDTLTMFIQSKTLNINIKTISNKFNLYINKSKTIPRNKNTWSTCITPFINNNQYKSYNKNSISLIVVLGLFESNKKLKVNACMAFLKFTICIYKNNFNKLYNKRYNKIIKIEHFNTLLSKNIYIYKIYTFINHVIYFEQRLSDVYKLMNDIIKNINKSINKVNDEEKEKLYILLEKEKYKIYTLHFKDTQNNYTINYKKITKI